MELPPTAEVGAKAEGGEPLGVGGDVRPPPPDRPGVVLADVVQLEELEPGAPGARMHAPHRRQATAGEDRPTDEVVVAPGALEAIVVDDDRPACGAAAAAAAAAAADVGYDVADLAEVTSLRELAARSLVSNLRLDVLVHNAGALHRSYVPAADGTELTWRATSSARSCSRAYSCRACDAARRVG